MSNPAIDWPSDTFVLVPSYKSAQSLKVFLPRLLEKAPAPNICIVDDASFDGTDDICKIHEVLYVQHTVNIGKGAALSSGFNLLVGKKHARWVLTMDADGQHSVDDIPFFLVFVKDHPATGICIGRRDLSHKSMPLSRIISNTITSKILSVLTGQKIADSQSGFRIYSAELLKQVHCKYTRFEMESEIILKASFLHFSIGFVKVQTLYFNRISHISHLKDTLRWLKAVFGVLKEMRKKQSLHE
jgi:Glycosyltransferases involved in cell wall biogenesis